MRATLGTTSEQLENVPLFAGLSQPDREGLAARLRRRHYARGQTIFLRGDPGSYLCLIQAGRVRIGLLSTDGKEVMLALLGTGDFFGELALLDGGERSANAFAVDECQLLLLGRDDFLEFAKSRPTIALHALNVLSRRLRQTDQLVQEAAFFDVPGRLATTLLRLAESLGEPASGGVRIARHLTQVELADMIGVSRESVNKWLSFYQRQGILRRERGLITVLKPEALQARAY